MRRKELYKVVRVISNNTRISVYAMGSYCKKYQKNEIVEAEPDSYGIMIFETWKDARSFFPLSIESWDIIKVQPIGRGRRVKFVSRSQSEDSLQEFYETKHGTSQRNDLSLAVPSGTICYPKVKVLE